MDYLTVSTAKPKLGRLMDRVLKKGEPVIIRRGNRFLQISEYVLESAGFGSGRDLGGEASALDALEIEPLAEE